MQRCVERVFHSSEGKTSEMLFQTVVGLASQIYLFRKDVLVSQINYSEKVIINGLSEVYLKRGFEQTC